MAIIVRSSKVSPKTPAAFWVEQCLAAGTEDEHGNIFRIIKLFWRSDANHKMTPYAKTKGFEDAEIYMDGQGFHVKYRRNGSLWWQQPVIGVGAFFAECPMTQYNLMKLASCYGDRLWIFAKEDRDIEQVVKDMYEKKIVNLPQKMKEFNALRIKGMHMRANEGADVAVGVITSDEVTGIIEDLKEKEKEIILEKEDLRKKEAELVQREENLVTVTGEIASLGVSIAPYGEEFLKTKKIYELRGIAKTVGVAWDSNTKKPELIALIMKKQSGDDFTLETAPESKPDMESLED